MRLCRRQLTRLLQARNPDLYHRCIEIGNVSSSGSNRVTSCLALDPKNQIQRYSVSPPLSKGPVSNFEDLVRFVFTPPHVKKPLPGEISDVFFEDIFSNGLSVQRLHCRWSVMKADIHSRGVEQTKGVSNVGEDGSIRPQRKYLGVIKLSALALRGLQVHVDDGGKTSIRIYDTAMPNNIWHAECMAETLGNTNKAKKMARQQLRVRLLAEASKSGIFKSAYITASDADLMALALEIRD